MNWTETRKVALGALLVCTALGVQACSGDDGNGEGTGMTENETMPTNSVPSPSGSAPDFAGPMASSPTPNNPASSPEPEPSTPGEEEEPEAAEPVATTPGDEEPPPAPVSEEALAAACAQAIECEQSTELECAIELGSLTAVVEALCPGLVGPYVECLGSMEGCDPDVACADESAALEACTENPPEGEVVSPEVVEMACENQVRCDPTMDLAMCLASYEVAGPLLEAQCPGASVPYVTCIAEMTGCDPAAECPDEVATLQACGLEVNTDL